MIFTAGFDYKGTLYGFKDGNLYRLPHKSKNGYKHKLLKLEKMDWGKTSGYLVGGRRTSEEKIEGLMEEIWVEA